jgi:hypothetical protein
MEFLVRVITFTDNLKRKKQKADFLLFSMKYKLWLQEKVVLNIKKVKRVFADI